MEGGSGLMKMLKKCKRKYNHMHYPLGRLNIIIYIIERIIIK